MSFMRRLSNPFAGWDRKVPRTDDLHPQIKDNIFRWQLDSADFSCLDHDSLLRANICSNKSYAEKVLKAAHKLGVIDSGTGRPDTTKIDRNMVRTMPVFSLGKQRELVMLLFFWEEEITRWRLLDSEEDEIQQKLGDDGFSEGLRFELEHTLKVLQARRRVLPSERDQSGRLLSVDDEQLPSYAEARAQRYG